jgi:hypothetical protein
VERSLCGCSFLEVFFLQRIIAFGPPKVMKNTSYSATTLPGSTALPFVISTGGAQWRDLRFSGLFLEMFFLAERTTQFFP